MKKLAASNEMKNTIYFFFAFLIVACSYDNTVSPNQHVITFEKINYFRHPKISTDAPFKYRLTYYFNNEVPQSWIELDSIGKVTTEYIYEYDDDGIHIGARYREDGNSNYSIEKVRFENDSMQITEWIDSIGKVYYTMTDYLNQEGKTFRAEFKGDKIHGYDSTFYNNQGFEKRIFFTNTKGKIYNDRTFEYDSVNMHDDWVMRKKIRKDTIREIHIREIYYDSSFVTADGIFYQGILSTGELSENSFSFTKNQDLIFQTRTADWDNQFGFLATKENGLFTASIPLAVIDTIYNGAISPDGNKIIYCIKRQNAEQIWLLERDKGNWTEPLNLTERSNIDGGYFYWLTDKDLFFHTPNKNGNIVQGKLEGKKLTITDSLANLNTESGTEFSPYVDKEKRFIIFTRYLEGNISQQGFFITLGSLKFLINT